MMKILSKTQLLSALLLSGAVLISGNVLAAEKFDIDAKLEQCREAYNDAHSGKMSVAEAGRAQQKHMKLMQEILKNLNKRNSKASLKTGEALTDAEIIQNLRVMGHLLEMIAGAHQQPVTEWNYAY